MRLKVLILLPVMLAACSPTVIVDENGWRRSLATLDAAMSSIPMFMTEPAPARAGDVRVTISTFGEAGCARFADTSVSRDGSTITIEPWNYIAPRDATCRDELVRVPHEVTLTLSAGTWIFRVRGRDWKGDVTTHVIPLEVRPDS